jgi:hypothetical protein
VSVTKKNVTHHHLVVVEGEGDLVPVVEVVEIGRDVSDPELEPPVGQVLAPQLLRQLLLNLKRMVTIILRGYKILGSEWAGIHGIFFEGGGEFGIFA